MNDAHKCPCCDTEFTTMRTKWGTIHIIIDEEEISDIVIKNDRGDVLETVYMKGDSDATAQ